MRLAQLALMPVLALLLAAPAMAGRAEDALKQEGDRWNAAYSAGDWTALRALYADDAWLMTNKAPVAKGADAIIAYLRRFSGRGAVVQFRFEPEDVMASRRFGVVVARYWMTSQLPGDAAPVRVAGRSMLIYKWQGSGRDGGWKLWRDMDNMAPDIPAE
ncbi:nuclear transport factor 2 family protein [Sandarakinorhabdus sp.]|jgi:ketosteroid isomerase-like protein|uniref:YybH family protein n=1 Tax=Sandarakinorhabdus sp. TaxID=1916663 RepID=UPI0033420777